MFEAELQSYLHAQVSNFTATFVAEQVPAIVDEVVANRH
jgi:hypothetical protein